MSESISLVRAVRDNRLLGATLPDGPWRKQVELLELLEDRALSLLVMALGRGSTKTTSAALGAVWNAALRNDLDGRLALGRTRYVLVAYPNETLAKEFVARVCGPIVEASTVIAPWATISSDRIDFTLPSGAKTCIKPLPCREAAVRSMTSSLNICDEFQGFGEGDGASSARAMLNALDGSSVPLGDDSMTWLLGTPPRQPGTLFEEMFTAAQNGTLPRAKAVQAATWDVRPGMSRAYLDRKRQEMGDITFRRELGAEFLEGDADRGFYDMRAFTFVDTAPKPSDASSWKVSLDLSFAGDNTGVVAVGPSTEDSRTLLMGVCEAIAPAGRLRSAASKRGREDRVLDEIARLILPLADVRPVSIVADVHEGDLVRSHFGRLGYQVKIEAPSGKRKIEQFVSTRARLVDGSLRCWRQPLLVAELARVRARDNETLELPTRGSSHADLACALAQGVWQFRHTGAAMPMGKPAGGPPGIASERPDALGRSNPTQRELLDGGRSNKHGRAGRKDPDREGVRFPGGPGVKQF